MGYRILFLALYAFAHIALYAQDLSTFKGRTFEGWIFDPCQPKQRIGCTHDADTPTMQIYDRIAGGAFKIRLRGVDAPELDQPRGREAMEALFRILQGNGASVYVEGRDKYGRTLGVIYTQQEADVNLMLVANGYAWVDDGRMPKARRRQLEAAQVTARERKLGLWADERPIKPSDWRKGKR